VGVKTPSGGNISGYYGSLILGYKSGLPRALSVSQFNFYASLGLSTSSNSSYAATITIRAAIYTRNGSTLSQLTSGSQTYAFTNTSSNSVNSLSGVRELSLPMNFSMSQAGDYWLGFWISSASAGANWFTAAKQIFLEGQTNIAATIGKIGAATNGSYQAFPGDLALYSTTATAPPASMAFSQLLSSVGVAPYYVAVNATF
jgi:hypothetical protein